MITDAIKNIRISPNSITPVYQQLMEALEKIATTSPTPVRLPSERALANMLSISRKSVTWAFNNLVEQGHVVRNGNKGTFTCPRPERAEAPEGAEAAAWTPHPLNLSHFTARRSPVRLSLLLFEDSPGQRAFWEHAVRAFNEAQVAGRAVITWTPAYQRTPHEYQEFARAGDFDLIQGHTFLTKEELLRPLSPELRREAYASDASWGVCYRSMPEELKDVLFPVYALYWEVFGCRALWDTHVAEPTARLGLKDLLAELPRLRARVPASCYLAESACTLVISRGVSADYSPEVFEQYCRRVAELAAHPRVFPELVDPEADTLDLFVSRKMLLLPVFSNWFLGGLAAARPPGDVFQELLWPEAGRAALSACGVLGVGRRAAQPRAAESFLHFLLTPEIQAEIFRRLQAVPIRRSVLPLFQAKYPAYSREECARFIECHDVFLRASPIQKAAWELFGALQDLAHGRATVEGVMRLAVARGLFAGEAAKAPAASLAPAGLEA